MPGTVTVNDRSVAWQPGLTVADLLRACNFIFPLLVVELDGVHVERDRYADTPVPEGARLQVIHLMSGG